jgi:hypothetical protein
MTPSPFVNLIPEFKRTVERKKRLLSKMEVENTKFFESVNGGEMVDVTAEWKASLESDIAALESLIAKHDTP